MSSIRVKTKALDKDTQTLAQSYAALKKANEPLIRKQAELENNRMLLNGKLGFDGVSCAVF